MNLYFGDIHNHCGITYGYGSLENALTVAREQLDFCSITGHAMWPDIPKKTPKTSFLVDFHEKGFNNLYENWDYVKKTIKAANKKNDFITFQSYEMHSSKYGDYHVLSTDDTLPLIYSKNPSSLYSDLKTYNKIIIPHHVAYTPSYRGIYWDTFDNKKSPVVEVFSKHGCSISNTSKYNYYHTMGPRDSRNTIYEGLKKGNSFSFIASSDHHAGYPGSHGDGRMVVLAKNKTRKDIFNAILKGNTYAITGDKIKCEFTVNNSCFGSKITSKSINELYLNIIACDYIEKIIVYKNLKPYKCIYYEDFVSNNKNYKKYKLRIEYGWGKNIIGFPWQGEIQISDGNIIDVETCFKGRNILAPNKEDNYNNSINAINNKITNKTINSFNFISSTVKNPSPLHSLTNAIIIEIEGNIDTLISLKLNDKDICLSLKELINNNISYHLDEYNSEAFVLSCIEEEFYSYNNTWLDSTESDEKGFYHVEISQKNGQMAWISSVFINYD